MAKDRKIEIKCQNLAPLSILSKEINASALQFAIYANNGEGKTFLSNIFRLLENNPSYLQDKQGNILTDKFISFDKNTCDFQFSISDKEGSKEDARIQINRGKIPVIPATNFIYHVFNQNYVNENSKVDYDKDGNITDYIIGKSNIDVSEDEKNQKSLEKQKNDLENKNKPEITEIIENRIGSISNIKRLSEYKDYLNYDSIYLEYDKPWENIEKSFKEYLIDYDKIKSVPEDLPIISEIPSINENIEFIKTVLAKLEEEFTLSTLADEFKKKISEKREFVEKGLALLDNENKCPFCEQYLETNARELIDKYTRFINDEETKTRKAFEAKKQEISIYIESVKKCNTSNIQSINKFNEYADKYFSSSKNEILENIAIEELINLLIGLNEKIDKKIIDISIPVEYENALFQNVSSKIHELNKIIKANNLPIKQINTW